MSNGPWVPRKVTYCARCGGRLRVVQQVLGDKYCEECLFPDEGEETTRPKQDCMAE